jgi:hypothetical protein
MRKRTLVVLPMGLSMLCGCAAGGVDFGDNTLVTAKVPNLSSSDPSSYSLLTPYFTNVKDEIAVSITKQKSPAGDAAAKAAADAATKAAADAKEKAAAYKKALDDYNNAADGPAKDRAKVARDEALLVKYKADADAKSAKEAKDAADAAGFSVVLDIKDKSFPTDKRYIYLHKSPLLFSDSGNCTTDIYGLATSMDTKSQQELTTVLGEVAKAGGGVFRANVTGEEDLSRSCLKALPPTLLNHNAPNLGMTVTTLDFVSMNRHRYRYLSSANYQEEPKKTRNHGKTWLLLRY